MRISIIAVALTLTLLTALAGVLALFGQGEPQHSEKDAIDVARDFLVKSPTFKFDGIGVGIKIVEAVQKSETAWEVTMTFESRHAGYGDRSGQMVAQVITPHILKVLVDRGKVKSAVMDDRWDELNQRPLP